METSHTTIPRLVSGQSDNAFLSLWEALNVDQEWRQHGRCLHAEPDLFYPLKGGSPEPAKRICNGTGDQPPCPVREECLEWAMKTGEVHGVWGGKSKEQRRKLRKERSREART